MKENGITIAPGSGPCHAADFGRGREITTAVLVPINLNIESDVMETGKKIVNIRVNWACSMGAQCINQMCHYSSVHKKKSATAVPAEKVTA